MLCSIEIIENVSICKKQNLEFQFNLGYLKCLIETFCFLKQYLKSSVLKSGLNL